jgi:tetratricopeptide (TPR) repeat protein
MATSIEPAEIPDPANDGEKRARPILKLSEGAELRLWRGVKLAGKWAAGAFSLYVLFMSYLFFSTMIGQAVIIRDLSVPKLLAENGFTGEVAAIHLRDAIGSVIKPAKTSLRHTDVKEQAELLDVVVPNVGISIRELAVHTAAALGLKPPRIISGEITVEGGLMLIRLRLNGQLFFTSDAGVDPRRPESLLNDAAKMVVQTIQPFLLADAAYNTDKCSAYLIAQKIIKDLPALDIQVKWAHNLLGVILAENGHYKDAIAEYDRAIQLDPQFALPYANRGQVLNLLHRGDAERDARKAVQLDPANAVSHAMLATVLMELDQPRYKEAAAEYYRAIELEPSNAGYHHDLGVALQELKDFTRALAEFRQAIKLEPTNPLPYHKVAEILRALGGHEGEAQEAAMMAATLAGRVNSPEILSARCGILVRG